MSQSYHIDLALSVTKHSNGLIILSLLLLLVVSEIGYTFFFKYYALNNNSPKPYNIYLYIYKIIKYIIFELKKRTLLVAHATTWHNNNI